MIERSETHLALRGAVRRAVETEVRPRLGALEHGAVPLCDIRQIARSSLGTA